MREQALLAADALLNAQQEPPAAVALFDPNFHEGVVNAGKLLLAAIPATVVAGLAFRLL